MKQDLKNQVQEAKKVDEQLSELQALRINISQLLRRHKQDWDAPKVMDTLVNLGAGGVFAQAHVSDTSQLFVEVGLNFYIEFDLNSEEIELMKILDLREEFLKQNFIACQEKTIQTKSAIHGMLALLDQMRILEVEEDIKEREKKERRQKLAQIAEEDLAKPQFI